MNRQVFLQGVEGLEVVGEASTGEAAVLLARHVVLDVIIMDIHMPIMDGNEATQRIKQFKKNLPVIIQSAYNIDGEKDISFSSGCDDYISKPVDKKILIEKISKYINVRKATSELMVVEFGVISFLITNC